LAGKAAIDAYFAADAQATSAAAISIAAAATEATNAAIKGERGATARPDGTPKPMKKFRYNKKKGRWQYKNPHTGKWMDKPPNWKPPGGTALTANEDGQKCE
jgi:hypothetical protein